MASKSFNLDEGLTATVYKRRGNRNLRLSVTAEGQVRVSIPAWTPYRVGLDFARSRQTWIKSQLRAPVLLSDGQAIGKAHHLSLRPLAVKTVSSRVTPGAVIVRYPADSHPGSPAVQAVAAKAGIRALRAQAEQLLPQRLEKLAAEHGFRYSEVRVKQLKSRWGSCDQRQRIVLNLFLMQLPWELIDYVLLHELTHTKVLRHGSDFWRQMDQLMPNNKALRKELRQYQPALTGRP